MAEARTFQEMIELTREAIEAFRKVENRPWTIETTLIELSKQVGDLAKRVLTYERYYLPDRDGHPAYRTTLDSVGNELADILYCLIRVALYYEIDLEAAHVKARRDELGYAAQSAQDARHGDVIQRRRRPAQRMDFNPVLDEYYVWMYGGEEDNVAKYEGFFQRQGVVPGATGRALDLGCGSGFQSLALARLGFHVVGIDISSVLLGELEKYRGDLPVKAVHGDIRDAALYEGDGPFDLAVCMTDTILCMSGEDEIWEMLANLHRVLVPGGRVFVSFRDFTVSAEGTGRVFPVRSDATRIWTTLIEYLPRKVRVNDMLYVGREDAWDFYSGNYLKLRLATDRFLEILQQTGFRSAPPFVEGPLTYFIAQRLE